MGLKAAFRISGVERPVELVNLTPHAVEVLTGDGFVCIPESGRVARVDFERRALGRLQIGGREIPVTESLGTRIIGLPAEQDGVVYIVSLMVASAAHGRGDLLTPDAVIRDDDGQAIGCRALSIAGASELAILVRPPGAPGVDEAGLPAIRVSASAEERDTPECAQGDLSTASTQDGDAPAPRARRGRSARQRLRPTMVYASWLAAVDRELAERCGREAAHFTCDWRRLYEIGLTPASAVSDALGSHDFV